MNEHNSLEPVHSVAAEDSRITNAACEVVSLLSRLPRADFCPHTILSPALSPHWESVDLFDLVTSLERSTQLQISDLEGGNFLQFLEKPGAEFQKLIRILIALNDKQIAQQKSAIH